MPGGNQRDHLSQVISQMLSPEEATAIGQGEERMTPIHPPATWALACSFQKLRDMRHSPGSESHWSSHWRSATDQLNPERWSAELPVVPSLAKLKLIFKEDGAGKALQWFLVCFTVIIWEQLSVAQGSRSLLCLATSSNVSSSRDQAAPVRIRC